MPKLAIKQKVLSGRAQVIAYERDPSTFYYRELVTGTKTYKTRKLSATTLEAAQLEAVDAYTALRVEVPTTPTETAPITSVTTSSGKTITNAIKDYLKVLRGQVTAGQTAQATYDMAEDVIYKLIRPFLLEEQGLRTTKEININTFSEYVVWRQATAKGKYGYLKSGKGVTKLTLHKELQQVRKWVNTFLLPNKYIKAELATDRRFIVYPTIKQADLMANPAINPEDWDFILRYVRNEWIKPKGKNHYPRGVWSRTMFWHWMLIMKNCGARPEEGLKLRWKDIEFEDVGRTNSEGEEVSKEIVHIALKSAKTGQARISSCNCVYVFERWLKFQKEWAEENGIRYDITPNTFVFAPPYQQNKPLSYSRYKQLWVDIIDACEGQLKGHIFSDERYTPYSLRSSFVEDNLLAGRDIFLIARASGHDVKTLMKYYERLDTRRRTREMTEFLPKARKKAKRRDALASSD